MNILCVSGISFFYCFILVNVYIKMLVYKYFVNNFLYILLMLIDNEYLNMYFFKINKIFYICEFCF